MDRSFLVRALSFARIGAPLALAGCSVGLGGFVYDLDAGAGGSGGSSVTSGSSSSTSTGTSPACVAPFLDKFSDDSLIKAWSVLDTDKFHVVDISGTQPGYLRLQPDPSSNNGWFQMTQGPLIYREITGNFVITTHVRAVQPGGGSNPPTGLYNTAGLIARSPNVATWVLNDVGYQEGTAGSIDKSTLNGSSTKYPPMGNAGPVSATLSICRIGGKFSMIRRFDGEPAPTTTNTFEFTAAQMPETLQVGLTVGAYGPPFDVEGQYAFVRLDCPVVDEDCLKPAANNP